MLRVRPTEGPICMRNCEASLEKSNFDKVELDILLIKQCWKGRNDLEQSIRGKKINITSLMFSDPVEKIRLSNLGAV